LRLKKVVKDEAYQKQEEQTSNANAAAGQKRAKKKAAESSEPAKAGAPHALTPPIFDVRALSARCPLHLDTTRFSLATSLGKLSFAPLVALIPLYCFAMRLTMVRAQFEGLFGRQTDLVRPQADTLNLSGQPSPDQEKHGPDAHTFLEGGGFLGRAARDPRAFRTHHNRER
jgi:hypothetical protein